MGVGIESMKFWFCYWREWLVLEVVRYDEFLFILFNVIFIFLFLDFLFGVEKLNLDVCDKLFVSNIIFNVIFCGGIKLGNFIDKGVVKYMDECLVYCCVDG